MPRRAFIAVLLPLAIAASCAREGPDEAAARAAFAEFLGALDRADAGALWALADSGTRKYFDDLVAEVKEAQALVDKHYPEADRGAAKRNLLGDLVSASTTGEMLFRALLDPARIAAPQDPDARAVDRVGAGPETVRVITASGDTIEFVREPDGTCRTGVLLRAAMDVPAVATLRQNLAAVKQNRDLIERTPPARDAPAPATGVQP
ncbi:MAG: hypothetical protein FJ087_04670 [Deltaproteobacteria bacterium]|nr:hypothetical protein [Deltaproteobacteria bacterium]